MRYFPTRFSPQAERLLDLITSLLEKSLYALDIRTIYYLVIGQPDPLIGNTKKGYNKVKKIIRDARYSGHIPFYKIADRTRDTYNRPVSIDQALSYYYSDAWKDQPAYLEVFVEKRGLAPLFAAVLQPYYVQVTPGGGHDSLTNVMEIAGRFHEYTDRPRYLLVFSDLDASGDHIAKDIQFRLGKSLMMLDEDPIKYVERGKTKICEMENLTVPKVALTFEQARELSLPALYQNINDTRAADFIARYGEKAVVELNAVPPEVLERMILDSVESLIDKPKMTGLREKEERIKTSGLEFLRTLENEEDGDQHEGQGNEA